MSEEEPGSIILGFAAKPKTQAKITMFGSPHWPASAETMATEEPETPPCGWVLWWNVEAGCMMAKGFRGTKTRIDP